jgi:hypothetical protein
MVGGGFQHINCSSDGHLPKEVIWKKDGSAPLSIHIDSGILMKVNPSKKNYAWLSESKTINNHMTASLDKYLNRIITILNNNKEIEQVFISTDDEKSNWLFVVLNIG